MRCTVYSRHKAITPPIRLMSCNCELFTLAFRIIIEAYDEFLNKIRQLVEYNIKEWLPLYPVFP